MEAAVRRLPSGRKAWLKDRRAGGARDASITTTARACLLRPLSNLRARHRPEVRHRRRGRRPARTAAGHAVTSISRSTSWESLVNDEFDMTAIAGQGARSRLCRAAAAALAARPDWPGDRRADRYQCAAVPAADAEAVLAPGAGPAPGDRVVSRGPAASSSSEPAASRTRFMANGRVSTTRNGTCGSSSCSKHDPEALTRMTHADYIRLGGAESVEQIMWLAMRGALGTEVRKVHQNYYLATTTAMTVVAVRGRVSGWQRDAGPRGHELPARTHETPG